MRAEHEDTLHWLLRVQKARDDVAKAALRNGREAARVQTKKSAAPKKAVSKTRRAQKTLEVETAIHAQQDAPAQNNEVPAAPPKRTRCDAKVTEEQLRAAVDEGKTVKEISTIYEVSTPAVYQRLKKLGLKAKGNGRGRAKGAGSEAIVGISQQRRAEMIQERMRVPNNRLPASTNGNGSAPQDRRGQNRAEQVAQHRKNIRKLKAYMSALMEQPEADRKKIITMLTLAYLEQKEITAIYWRVFDNLQAADSQAEEQRILRLMRSYENRPVIRGA